MNADGPGIHMHPCCASCKVSPWGQLQHKYADATGHSPVYPAWASGFWQCRLRYHNQTQIIDTVRGYIDRGYPISLIIIDFYNWVDPVGNVNTLGDETLPKTCWCVGGVSRPIPYTGYCTKRTRRVPLARILMPIRD